MSYVHKTSYVISYHEILCHNVSYVMTITASLLRIYRDVSWYHDANDCYIVTQKFYTPHISTHPCPHTIEDMDIRTYVCMYNYYLAILDDTGDVLENIDIIDKQKVLFLYMCTRVYSLHTTYTPMCVNVLLMCVLLFLSFILTKPVHNIITSYGVLCII